MAAAAGWNPGRVPDLDAVGDLRGGARRGGVVNAPAWTGEPSEALSELDGARRGRGTAAPSGDSVEKAPLGGETQRSRGEKGQEAESAAAAVAGRPCPTRRDRHRAEGQDQGAGAGCGDFFSWASGGLFGTPGGREPSDAEGEKSDAYDTASRRSSRRR